MMKKIETKIDSLFSEYKIDVKDFSFDEKVAEVFSDMINRSVPGYDSVLKITGLLAEKFSKPNTNIYDLGCSIGDSSISMARYASSDCVFISVDNSKAMLDKFKERVSDYYSQMNFKFICEDVCNIPIRNASMISLNYTLQFIPVEKRNQLLKKIYQGMINGSVLILSEKIKFDDVFHEDFFTGIHHRFKNINGYTDIEISQKRQALEDVLVPESFLTHRNRLIQCGFKKIYICHQCLNFISIVAIK